MAGMEEQLTIIVVAALSTMTLSFIYRMSWFYKLITHITIGLATGVAVQQGWAQWIDLTIPRIQGGEWVYILAIFLGLLFYTRFFARVYWVARIPIAFTYGVGIGLCFNQYARVQLLNQIGPTIWPIFAADPVETLYNIIIFIGVISVIFYFFFSVEHKGALAVPSKLGRYFLMATFGASLGYLAQGRFTMAIGALQNIVAEPAIYIVAPIAVILILFDIWRRRGQVVPAS
jgi:hypothetical protein